MLIYIVAYIDGVVVHANNVYISESFAIDQQKKYVKAIYSLQNSEIKLDEIKEEFTNSSNDNILNQKEDKYNTINYDFQLLIEWIGIKENLFTFPMTFNNEDYDYINGKKIDANMIDLELMDVTNINKGFMIGGHSSGLWFDESHLKKVFNNLENFSVWDTLKIIRNDWVEIKYEAISKEIKTLDEKIVLSNRFYIYTCHPVGSNEKRLVIELKEVK